MKAAVKDNRIGIAFGLTAIIIWGSIPAATALGIQADLSPMQIALLRYGIATPFFLHIALRGPHSVSDWLKSLALACGAGTPYVLIVAKGLAYAPASHGGVILPGVMILASLIAGHYLLHETLTRNKILGVGLILIGLLLLAAKGTGPEGSTLIGDLLFIVGGFLWASYAVLLRFWALDGVLVAARVSLLSLLMVSVPYAVGWGDSFANIQTFDIALQGIWQGVFSVVVGLVAFNKAIEYLGVGKSTTLTALMPVFSTIFAFFLLSETPAATEWAGLIAIMFGVGVAVAISAKRPKEAESIA